MAKRLGVAAALVDQVPVPGDVIIDDGQVRDVGVRPAADTGLAVPGFVDLQLNGFAGVDLSATDIAGFRSASQAIARTGTASFLTTIPTIEPGRYPDALNTATAATLSALPGARSVGIHLEGPFLSPSRAGAHVVDWLREPDSTYVDQLLDGVPISLVTMAPELAGGLDLVAHLVDRGVVVSVGHSDASGHEAHCAFDAGASAVTHLWNAQSPMTSREPGVVGVALARSDVAVCLIADLVHLDADTLAVSMAAAGARTVVVTDAVALAGLADGVYTAGGRSVTLTDNAVRLEDGTLAGSASPMDAALRNLVGIGVPLERAVASMTLRPARLLGRPDLGRLRPGAPASVAVLDDALEVVRVLVGGVDVS